MFELFKSFFSLNRAAKNRLNDWFSGALSKPPKLVFLPLKFGCKSTNYGLSKQIPFFESRNSKKNRIVQINEQSC